MDYLSHKKKKTALGSPKLKKMHQLTIGNRNMMPLITLKEQMHLALLVHLILFIFVFFVWSQTRIQNAILVLVP